MGGGRSFGSKPIYQRSAPAPSRQPASSPTKSDQAAQQPVGASPSPMGRWGGMLGGLFMGGLIGSLLFGGGFRGPGLLDLLFVGGGLFLLFRFLRARRMAATSPSAGSTMPFEHGSASAWGRTRYTPSEESEAAGQQQVLPPGFDAEEFLKGVKTIYARLQAAWDKRDIEDIRSFTSTEVFTEIQQQAKDDPMPGKTELLLIKPSILEVQDTGQQIIVSVLYDVMLRENEDEFSKQVRELWHFSRDLNNPESFWTLEGIQQVE
jgi:predicted lipid-binding transport protein (Tim44 family)